MSVHEEIREQQKKLKGQGFKAHWDYFWEYYKIHTIVVIVAIIFISMLLHDVLTSKPYGFYAVMLNSGASSAQDILEKEFVEYTDFDSENYDCFIDTSSSYNLSVIDEMTIATSQKMMANIAAAELDVLVADSDVFTYYANQETFADLRTVLSTAQLEAVSDRLVYVDQSYLDYLNSEAYQDYISTGNFDETNKYAVMADNYNKDFKMPSTDKDTMEEPVPVGITVSDSTVLSGSGAYYNSSAVAGVVINSKRPALAAQFLYFLCPELAGI